MAAETELERMVVRLVGDAAEYQKMLRDAQASASKTAKEIEGFGKRMESIGGSLSSFGKSMSLFVTLPLVAAGTAAVMSAGKFEQTTIAFETMLGSASEAKKLLDDLTVFAAKTPFEMPEIEAAARGLVMFGDRGEELMKTLKVLGDVSAGTGTQFSELALIYNQVRGAGKLLTQDFRQLSMRGVISLQDIANHFGKTTAEAQKMMTTGKIGFEDLRAILEKLSSEGGRFANMTERQSESLLGRISTLKDAFGIMLRQIGQELAPMVKRLTNFLIDLTSQFEKLSPSTRKAIASLIILLGVLGPTLFLIGKLTAAIGLLTYTKNVWAAATTAAAVTMSLLKAAFYGVQIAAMKANTVLITLRATLLTLGIGAVITLVVVLLDKLGLIGKVAKVAGEELDRLFDPDRFTKAENVGNERVNPFSGMSNQPMAGQRQVKPPTAIMPGQTGRMGGDLTGTAQAMQMAMAAAKAMKRHLEGVDKATKDLTKDLKLEAETFGMTSREVDIYKLKMSGATDEQLRAARELDKKLTKMEEEKKLVEKAKQDAEKLTEAGKQITKDMRTPLEVFNDRQKELQELLDKNAISTDTFTRAMSDAEKQMNREYMADFKVTGVDAVQAGSAEALARLEEYRAGLRKPLHPGAFMSQPSTFAPTQTAAASGAGAAGGGGRDDARLERIAAGIEKLVQLAEDFQTVTI